jgi:stage II sporulation protein D
VPYDIKCTNIHQTYKGYQKCAQIELFKKVSRDTKGVILAYSDKMGAKRPILAMFDSACGGAIPSRIAGVNFEKAPYLARTYACNFCKNYKLTNWVQEYAVKDLEQLLKKEFPRMTKLADIKVGKKDRAGMVTEIKIKANSWQSLFDKRITAVIKGLKSRMFTIERKGAKITFKGVGYGHCLGLCQWGARKMIELGWNARKILEFFYPDIFFMRLTSTTSPL